MIGWVRKNFKGELMPELYWIDAFSQGPFSGNPAGVCLLDGPAPEAWMQAMAAELGISETAYVWPEGDLFRLRWFTPACEVALCGHATLAAGAALLESGRATNDQPLRFMTLSGELRAWRRKDNGMMELDFPQEEARPCPPPEGMLAALGLLSCAAAARAGEDWLLEAADEEAVRVLSPDFKALAAFGGRGVCVTARSSAEGDFVSRFFGPAVGIDEDPVTGSAHGYLGPWWASRLGHSDLLGRQLSRRGGRVHISLKHGRAFLAGDLEIVFRTSLKL
jgi:PhzF family phenazine biosynthesis protein